MKHLGYIDSIGLHVFVDADGDVKVSVTPDLEDGLWVSGNGVTLDDTVAAIKALTADPTTRLVAAVRAAVVAYKDPDDIEVNLQDLVDAYEAFEAAAAERQ